VHDGAANPATVSCGRGICCNGSRARGGSSAGQSSGLIIRRSWVRVPAAPPTPTQPHVPARQAMKLMTLRSRYAGERSAPQGKSLAGRRFPSARTDRRCMQRSTGRGVAGGGDRAADAIHGECSRQRAPGPAGTSGARAASKGLQALPRCRLGAGAPPRDDAGHGDIADCLTNPWPTMITYPYPFCTARVAPSSQCGSSMPLGEGRLMSCFSTGLPAWVPKASDRLEVRAQCADHR
jgi:hypothetical protein